ncbi:MAG: proprotein convertase P-domain-containing protein, partial [Actinomycetota bacterium]
VLVGPVRFAFGAGTCTFAEGVAAVIVTSADDAVTLGVDAGAITMNGSPCGEAGVANTERISVLDASAGDSNVTIDLSGGAFAPGLTDEPGDSDEIELDVDLGGGVDQLTVLGGATGDHLAATGPLGLNLNADEVTGVDADVNLVAVEMSTFSGGPGADRISGGPGGDTFQGGTGFDTVDYSASAGPVTVTIGDGAPNDGRSGEGDEVAGDIEHVIGSGFDDRLTGDGSAELLAGGRGSDRLTGLGGDDELRGDEDDDVLLGGSNDDHLIGGTGNDDERAEAGNDAFTPSTQIHAESYPSLAIRDQVTTTATISVAGLPTPAWDVNVRVDVEHPAPQQLRMFLIAPSGTRTPLSRNFGNGTPFQGTVFDSEAATTINKAGSRTFAGRFHPEGSMELFRGQNPNGTWGLEMRDTTAGTVGTLNMWRLQFAVPDSGDDGDDALSGGSGTRDIIDWAGRTQALTVTLAGGADDGQPGEADNMGAGDIEECYGSNGNDDITGTSAINDLRGQLGSDRISGLAGNDQLRGGVGVDTIAGGDSNDTIEGGGANDSIDGGAGFDFATYGRATTAVTVNIGTGSTSGGEGSDSLRGVENASGSKFGDTLRGAWNANVLVGGSGNDSMFGLAGNDRLDGQSGTDKADGGTGTDTCVSAETRVSCER